MQYGREYAVAAGKQEAAAFATHEDARVTFILSLFVLFACGLLGGALCLA